MSQEDFLNRSKEIYPQLVAHRRYLHQNPELSFNEFETSRYVKENLDKLNISYKVLGKTGVVALIGKGEDCVALRADMDALPISEKTGLEFTSKNAGVMHACGHDMHTSMLLGAAKILKEIENSIPGQVKLIFQPSEEKIPSGASLLVSEGVLENPTPKAIFAQHVFNDECTGKISITPGHVMASTDELYWTIRGKGCHASTPHLGGDPILASSNLVIHLQSMMTKYRNPLTSGVISVTSFHGGSATNIISDEVELMGTFRTYDPIFREEFLETVNIHSKNICNLYKCECEFKRLKGYPSVINSIDTTEIIKKSAIHLLGNENVLPFIPKMWGEDFSFYLEKIPGTFWFLGIRPKELDIIPGLHNPSFSPDEQALITGTAMLVSAAVEFLSKHSLKKA